MQHVQIPEGLDSFSYVLYKDLQDLLFSPTKVSARKIRHTMCVCVCVCACVCYFENYRTYSVDCDS